MGLKKYTNIGALAVLLGLLPLFNDCSKGFQTNNSILNSVASINAPTLSVTNPPTAWVSKNTYSLVFEGVASSPATITSYTCQLDSSAAGVCTSPLNLSGLDDRTHHVILFATDSNGIKSNPIDVPIEIDTTGPTVNFLNASTTFSTNSPVISFSASDAGSGVASMKCAIDGAQSACTSNVSFSLPQTGNGAHVVTVTAADVAGNSTSQNLSITIATAPPPTGPVISIKSVTGQYFTTATPSITFTVTDTSSTIKTIQCQVDAGTPGNCTSPFVLPKTGEGVHTVTVTATNASGLSSQLQSGAFTIDTVAPTISNLVGPVNCISGSCTNAVTFLAKDATSGVASTSCSVNGAAAISCASPFTLAANYLTNATSTPATVSVSVVATDKATNKSLAVTTSFTVTATPSPVTCGKPGQTTGTFHLSATDGTTTNGQPTARDFEVIIPANYGAAPLPIVLAFHGAGGTESSSVAYGIQNAPGASGAAIYVFPQALIYQNSGTVGWTDTCGSRDMVFINNILTMLETNYCVDTKRIFAAGFSWGCDFATALNCCSGANIRAISGASCTDEYNTTPIASKTAANYYLNYDNLVGTGLNLNCPSKGGTGIRFTHDASGGDSAYPAPLFTITSHLYQYLNSCSSTSTPVLPTNCVSYNGCKDPYIECAYPNLGHTPPPNWGTDTYNFFATFK